MLGEECINPFMFKCYNTMVLGCLSLKCSVCGLICYLSLSFLNSHTDDKLLPIITVQASYWPTNSVCNLSEQNSFNIILAYYTYTQIHGCSHVTYVLYSHLCDSHAQPFHEHPCLSLLVVVISVLSYLRSGCLLEQMDFGKEITTDL